MLQVEASTKAGRTKTMISQVIALDFVGSPAVVGPLSSTVSLIGSSVAYAYTYERDFQEPQASGSAQPKDLHASAKYT